MANTKYYRLMLGKGSRHAEQCLAERFIGADYGIERDLSRELPDSWRQFNAMFIPVYQEAHPEKTKVAAGLVSTHRVDERERLRTLEYVHLFNIL